MLRSVVMKPYKVSQGKSHWDGKKTDQTVMEGHPEVESDTTKPHCISKCSSDPDKKSGFLLTKNKVNRSHCIINLHCYGGRTETSLELL